MTDFKPSGASNFQEWPDVPGADFSASQVIENVGPLDAEIDDIPTLNRRCEWKPVNEVTWKLESTTEFENTPASHGQWPWMRSRRALAWVIGFGSGHRSWLARCGDRSVGPTTIGKAKAAALAMVTDPGMGKRLDDPVKHLNAIAARYADIEDLPKVAADLASTDEAA